MLMVFLAFRLRAANREALAREEREKEEQRARELKEKELLERLEKLKKRDDLQMAKNAIDKDPKRAAKVLSKMMRGK